MQSIFVHLLLWLATFSLPSSSLSQNLTLCVTIDRRFMYVVIRQVTSLVKHKFDRWPCQNYPICQAQRVNIMFLSGMSFAESKQVGQSREWKLEWFECRRANLNYYYMLLISYSCRLCMVAEWEITICYSWKCFYSWKNSHNFLVILSSRCQSLLAQTHCLKWNHRRLLSVGDSK